ncbi:hypothetical protein GCM10027288_14660 [Bordetella tumbae]
MKTTDNANNKCESGMSDAANTGPKCQGKGGIIRLYADTPSTHHETDKLLNANSAWHRVFG